MAHRLFFILFLFCESLLFSQTADLDSLKTVLRNNTLADTTRVNTLFALIDQLKIDHLKPEESYLKDALAISISLEDKEKEAIARRQYAQYYRVKGIFDKSLEQLILAVKIFDSIHAPKSEKLIANSELSILYRNTGDLKKSLAIALKNYNLIKNDPDTPKKGRYYFDIGNCYSTLKNYKKAEEIYKAGIVICKNANFLPGEMLLTSALADIYKKNKQYNRAEKLFNKALLHYQKQKNDINIAASYYSLGTIHSLKGEHKKSIKPYLQALKIYNERENLYFIKVINQHLFIAYSILGQQEKAEKAQEIYDKIKDSIDSKERKKYTQELKTKYETDKIILQKQLAEKQALLAQSKSKQNRNYFLGTLFILGLLAIASILHLGRVKAQKKAELITIQLKESQKRLALEKQNKDSELKALKAQMNPHFIFNALNSIQEYIVLNKKNKASDYLGKFADLIRNYLNHSNTGKISLQEEIENLQRYLELECLRFEEELQCAFNVDPNINTEEVEIPTMLIQPYIENALKHGLLHRKTNRVLNISFSKKDDIISCVVEDNGVGRKKSKEIQEKRASLHQSFASKATEERLKLLNFNKKKKIGVQIEDLYNEKNQAIGTRVTISIPILK